MTRDELSERGPSPKSAPAPDGMLREAIAYVIRTRTQVGGTDWNRLTLAGDLNDEELADAILALIGKEQGR